MAFAYKRKHIGDESFINKYDRLRRQIMSIGVPMIYWILTRAQPMIGANMMNERAYAQWTRTRTYFAVATNSWRWNFIHISIFLKMIFHMNLYSIRCGTYWTKKLSITNRAWYQYGPRSSWQMVSIAANASRQRYYFGRAGQFHLCWAIRIFIEARTFPFNLVIVIASSIILTGRLRILLYR